jgi:uncharacterized membrane protein YccC
MTVPGANAWLFSVKTFAAAMVALYISFSLGLDHPYWAMATVYIVAQPLIGSVRSKSMYRLLGTLLGATATLVLVPNLVDAPELLTAALALWIGICLYAALLDRTPRSYLFMLAGYTAALIGFPSVSAPDAMWDIAVSRVEEIGLGIVCITVLSSVVLPRQIGPVLSARLGEWLRDADALAVDALTAHGPAASGAVLDISTARLRMAESAVELRTLTTLLAYDTSRLPGAVRAVGELERRMVLVLPVLAAVRDRLVDLRAVGGVTPDFAALLAQLRAWVESGTYGLPADAAFLRSEIAGVQEQADARRDWAGALLTGLLIRLRETVDLRQDCLDLQRFIVAGGRAASPRLAFHMPRTMREHHDHGIALLGAAVAALSLLVVSGYWIASGWPDGGQAAALAAVACCLTATQDDPVPSIRGLLVMVVLAAAFVAIGSFVILPLATNFEMLTLALAGFFIPVGVLAAMPATQRMGNSLALFTASLLALEGSYAADFAAWANGTSSALFGVAVAAAVSAVVRPAGAAWSVRRLLRAGWADLAAAARSRTPPQRAQLVALFLDRLGLLAPRLAMAASDGQRAAIAAMADVRVGVNLVELQRLRRVMAPGLGAAVEGVLRGAADHFDRQVATAALLAPPDALLGNLDGALDAATAEPARRAREIVRALVGLRCNLFPNAPAYCPATAGADAPFVPAQ